MKESNEKWTGERRNKKESEEMRECGGGGGKEKIGVSWKEEKGKEKRLRKREIEI